MSSTAFENRIAARRQNFKKASGDSQAMRRRREDATLQIRKKEKAEQLVRRRRLEMDDDEGSKATTKDNSSAPTKNDIPSLVTLLKSSDPDTALEALVSFRKMLSKEDNPPIADVIAAGVLPRFKYLLDNPTVSKMQFEAAWALTNVASGSSEQTRAVIELGAVDSFRNLLSSEDTDLQEQSIWAMANIAGDGAVVRDACLERGVLPPLLAVIRAGKNINIVRLGTWAVSNFCRGKPVPALDRIVGALPTLAMVLGLDDVEALADALWAVSYICDGPTERIDAILQSGMVPRMVHLLGHDSTQVHTPALRAIGNIATGSPHQTGAVVDAGALPTLLKLITSPRKTVRKEVVWTVSNICADQQTQIQKVIESGILGPIVEILSGGADYDVRKEAAWTVCNLCSGGSPEQVKYLVDKYPTMAALSSILDIKDTKMVQVALEAFEGILRTGAYEQDKRDSSTNHYVEALEECGALTKIEELQQDESEDVYIRAVRILENYCDVEDENQAGDGNVHADGLGAPATTTSHARFAFA
ncbi:hypothetical protein FOZ62_002044 [Perkinsus olseni]|uniref:Importin subunit alpha n=2 Tax=Perkinsus olseni TaxID=32597 RepID=A0A7J6SIR0_PEROL|nr:hypothetical protein FOZ62_002044 [Perkinsus olseni]